MQDITRNSELQARLTFQAVHDSLTGLINRREFERRLEQLILAARNEKSTHLVCYLDLDQFKLVNDTCGHRAGDALLRQIAHELKAVLRKNDTLARLGATSSVSSWPTVRCNRVGRSPRSCAAR